MTPTELGALQKRRLALQRQQDIRLGTAVAFLAEPWRNREARPEPFSAEDVFPWLREDWKPAEEAQPIDPATIVHRMRCLEALMKRGRKKG